MTAPYYMIRPQVKRLPVVLSCPHSGTEIPADIAQHMAPEVAAALTDTDWFVHELYNFAPKFGITLLHARFSRYVIDLNRDPTGRPLYQDHRRETGLVPLRTFAGQGIYQNEGPDAAEIKRRLDLYYAPYHAQIGKLLSELRVHSPHVLFFDAHSIKRLVPSIRAEPFPDLILGDQQGKTAHASISQAALKALNADGRFRVSHNDPFMGGYLTRRFGQPKSGVHALQLEMAQDIYMDEAAAQRDGSKQASVSTLLAATLEAVMRALKQLAAP